MNILHRKPIWYALSDLYLDTELQDFNLKSIAEKIKQSPYTLEEVKQIDKTEVFPVLYSNVTGIAGIWLGFQEEWLASEIEKNLSKKTRLKTLFNNLRYFIIKGRFADDWEKIKSAYQEQVP